MCLPKRNPISEKTALTLDDLKNKNKYLKELNGDRNINRALDFLSLSEHLALYKARIIETISKRKPQSKKIKENSAILPSKTKMIFLKIKKARELLIQV